MAGEADLARLLSNLSPRLNDGRYVYTHCPADQDLPHGVVPVVTVREDEGVTLVRLSSRPMRWPCRMSSSQHGSHCRSTPPLRPSG